MAEGQPPKKIRKGAKSCTECRRRKIRCVWLSDASRVCRRCEERGSACVPQTFSSQTTRSDVLNSRDRITRLERQVTDLTVVINGIQVKLGGDQIAVEPLADRNDDDDDDEDGSVTSYDDSEEAADALETEAPSHLKTLFDNNVISTGDAGDGNERRREKMSSLLVSTARDSLRRLVPSKQEVMDVAPFAKGWIALYQAMFPSQSVPSSKFDLVAKYDEMQKPDVDPTVLATWLVSIAITIQQVPEEKVKTFVSLKHPSHYCKTISDVIEKHLIAHDSLVGTIGGISMAMHYVRLQASRAGFKKLWLTLRRIIAIAELIGLPRISQTYYAAQSRLSMVKREAQRRDGPLEEARKVRAEAWVSICTLDRILGMMCNLPPGTSRYALPRENIGPEEPLLFYRAYLRNLADIASKVQDLDDLRMSGGSDNAVCNEVLKIDQELTALANTAPRIWWDENQPVRLPEAFIPYWHYYITLRTHLVLTLQRDESHRFDYSRFTCMKSCQIALTRFLKLRPMMAGGFFLGRLLNLQALTASVVLLLSWHGSKTDIGFHFQAQTIGPPKELVAQVVATMEKMSMFKTIDFSKQAISTIKSLSALLEEDGKGGGNGTDDENLTLRVPLLGKIHVQRNEKSQPHRQVNGTNGYALNMNHQLAASQQQQIPYNTQATSMSMTVAQAMGANGLTAGAPAGGIDGWHFDPFTWVIEDDRESAFRDAISAEDFSYFESPGEYGNSSLHYASDGQTAP